MKSRVLVNICSMIVSALLCHKILITVGTWDRTMFPIDVYIYLWSRFEPFTTVLTFVWVIITAGFQGCLPPRLSVAGACLARGWALLAQVVWAPYGAPPPSSLAVGRVCLVMGLVRLSVLHITLTRLTPYMFIFKMNIKIPRFHYSMCILLTYFDGTL